MAWEYQKSLDRIEKHLDGMGEIEVRKLTKLADLESLLSEMTCREIFGSHVYVDVPTFPALATAATDDETMLKRVVQAVHIYEREVSRIVEWSDLFDGIRVHFQGAKLHALFYRPIDVAEKLATRAVLLQIVLRDFVEQVFAPEFPKLGSFRLAGGADIGDVIGTRNGMRGDRELLFLGAPANYAAKIIGKPGTFRITKAVYEVLSEDLQDLCIDPGDTDSAGGGIYEISAVKPAKVDELCEAHEIAWDRETSAERIREDKRQFPLSEVSVESAYEKIDLDTLSIRKNKQALGASIFADVAGFTKYIDSAETEEEKKEALRVFHAIRREMSRVVRHDFDGLRIQYQGDRLQGLFHLPKDDGAAIVTKAVEAAVGLQSSMIKTLPVHLPKVKDLSLAIGIDVGPTFVSKLGTRGHRDRICIGEAVEEAAACEERHAGGEIALTRRAYEALPEEMQGFFQEDERTGDYVAVGLTADKLERAMSTSMWDKGPVFLQAGASGVTVSASLMEGTREVHPARSFAGES